MGSDQLEEQQACAQAYSQSAQDWRNHWQKICAIFKRIVLMKNLTGQKHQNSHVPLVILSVACVVVFILWLLYPTTIIDHLIVAPSDEQSSYGDRGLFGDQFGALSSLFSGLAFAGIICTILLQREDLNSTKNEVARQNNISERQTFESTFFQMLISRQEILKSIEILGKSGRKALHVFYVSITQNDKDFPIFIALKHLSKDDVRDIQNEQDVEGFRNKGLSEADISTISQALTERPTAFDAFLDSDEGHHISKLRAACEKAIDKSLDEIAHYVRYTIWIYQYIDSNTFLSDEEKKSYSDIFKSQLAGVEIATIFYFAIVPESLTEWGEDPLPYAQMKKLVKEYKIAESLNDRFIIHNIHRKLFEK
ncbi:MULTISPECIES: putative phage abortive infection protein [unclassified Microbulbifer]|uniref:putative phage abortive infection protein n=1 Tax=unclassified Microbulbifer TaxID=2619833 RepID=UPI0027E59538|nr:MULTISPECIES: putative phage abortive infection protein [unclassified Microbulbifer]